jgi:hypothetical protein
MLKIDDHLSAKPPSSVRFNKLIPHSDEPEAVRLSAARQNAVDINYHESLHRRDANFGVDNFTKVTKTTFTRSKVAWPLKLTERRSTTLRSKKLARNLNQNLNLRKRPKEC